MIPISYYWFMDITSHAPDENYKTQQHIMVKNNDMTTACNYVVTSALEEHK